MKNNSILESLKKIYTKMTGKKVVKRKTETDVLSDIAESYDPNQSGGGSVYSHTLAIRVVKEITINGVTASQTFNIALLGYSNSDTIRTDYADVTNIDRYAIKEIYIPNSKYWIVAPKKSLDSSGGSFNLIIVDSDTNTVDTVQLSFTTSNITAFKETVATL